MIKPLLPLPKGWKHQLIDSLATRGSGHTPDREKQEYWNGGIKWVSLTDSDRLDRRWIRETTSEISNLGIRHSSAVLHPENTVILSRDAGVGKSAVLAVPMAVSQHFIAWQCGQELEPFMLYYWLQYHKAFFERMAVGSTIQTIGLGVFKKLAGTFPPFCEQRKITEILNTWDDALETLDALIAAKERSKKALMQQLLSGKKRLNGYVKPWKSVSLGSLLESADRYKEWDDDRTVRLAGVRRNGGGLFFRAELPASEIKVKTAKTIREGDFLISRRQITYGGMAVVPRQFHEFEVNDEYEVLVSRDPDKFDIAFFGYLAHTPRLKHLAYLASNGFFAERLRLNFDLPAFLDSRINVPTEVGEQRAVAGLLNLITNELGLLRTQRAVLDQQKRGLMQRLLTGKLRVRV